MKFQLQTKDGKVLGEYETYGEAFGKAVSIENLGVWKIVQKGEKGIKQLASELVEVTKKLENLINNQII